MDNIEATLKAAVEQAADAIMLTELSGVIQYVNAAFERVSGYARSEVLGRHVRLLKSGQHGAAFYRTLWMTLCQGQVWSGIFVNRRKDGRLYEDQTVISPVRNEGGSVVGYLAVKRDVTVERQKELQRRQAQKLDAIGRLAGGVAHDFNNALMTIMGHAEMLEHRLSQTGGSSEEITEIKGACDRAASLTRQLLAFGRRQVPDLVVLDANRAVLGLEKMLRRLLGEDIRVSLVPSPRPALVRFEVGQIEQIIMALAVRASEVMPSGGTFAVTVCGAETESLDDESAPVPQEIAGGVVLRVADSGFTLDRDALDQIFEPFSSSVRQPWESGLSLATAHALVSQCGGHISVRSAPGDGSEFAISLPRAAPDGASTVANVRDLRSLSGSETVLLADDEDGVRESVRAGLSRLGYRVIDAPDGATAMERAAAQTGRIHLLITDVVMPGMSARELAERMLALQPAIKVIYMSGYSDAAIGDHGVSERGAAFLRKPFTAEALARRVREVLG
ncbi:MAG: domain S-box-containing protein [candidate division NC10 bacterium]|nr:domain S-box-containing protein [candidate division NC10 bacterium]